MAEAPQGSVVKLAEPAQPAEASEAPAAAAPDGVAPPTEEARSSQVALRQPSQASSIKDLRRGSKASRSSRGSRGSRKRSHRSRRSEPPPLQAWYGGIDGPNSEYVRLVAGDEHEFIIERRFVEVSGRIKRTLNNQKRHVDDDEPNELVFAGIPSHILAKVCQYFAFKVYYTFSGQEVEEFPIPFEIALQLLMTASYLDC